ncbi:MULTISPECIES: arylsulfatase [Leeuwenhoekiella]|uniref:Arylsulfatase (Aryl-sulfate sulphohydrolase) n=1 Tax=Leeuwenhoekiella blandensis (strain CECT 7118 / CCUG 51940 / KCTC 22103 / MED217) TaxID=398720 RepID=A3XPM3_LEEBM|nr:arylsulfatase [Leeuwenhoekiella blandensis]EAQ48502.1 arylsulfatase (aryl-sulfate sulphohydrolase) [Leeuwenhoekiella blandensis MED217]HCW64611.1 arylsulfatase [Leeuwenhoekiella sp.]|tara:strand:- start:72089 stop:73801 length:1713 start_codon:yes stop_codon:yes gene_type:complete
MLHQIQPLGRKICLFSTLSLFFINCKNDSASENQTALETPQKPNIVVIMADDLGFSDLGCYGGEVDTPALNGLAENGLRFNAFYNTSRCCPSRAALLTGQYPHQAGIGQMTMDRNLPGYRGRLDEQTVTLAEVLKTAGYQTGMVGKWHVSPTENLGGNEQLEWLNHQTEKETFSDLDTYPTARGFDKYYGNIWGVVDYFDPFALVNGTEPVKEVPKDFYYTDAIGDSAVAYVDHFVREEKPFFLYVAHCAPHWPLMAPEEEIKKYEQVYDEGWQKIREERYKKLIEKGIFKGDTTKLSEFMFPDLKWAENENENWDSRAMAVHAAMIDRMDQNIGKLIDKLEATGQLDNTVIMFMSDNGASSERPSQYGIGFDRPSETRDGREIHYPVKKSEEHLPGPETVMSGIGPVWANVANTPFRYWKARVYEGGITSPFIVHWPAGIKEQGIVKSQAAHIIDIMPTLLELSGATYPEEFNGNTIDPYMGESMVSAFTNTEEAPINETLFWEHFGAAALRQGDWKLVKLDGNADWELYNLKEDRTEMNNLAAKYPERLKAMQEEWNTMAKATDVFPN